jgi:hypothetical protein
MCIINNTNKFIFIHVPKSAGTSITMYLSSISTCRDIEIGGTELGELIQPLYKKFHGLTKHATFDEINNSLGRNVINNFFTFGFVRNPYKRAISLFTFFRQWDGWFEYYDGDEFVDYEEFLKKANINDFIQSKFFSQSDGVDRLFKPQAFWLGGNAEDKKSKVSYVGHVEDMERSINFIRNKIGCHELTNKVKMENASNYASNNSKVISDLTRTSLDIINKNYSIDFKLYGYHAR